MGAGANIWNQESWRCSKILGSPALDVGVLKRGHFAFLCGPSTGTAGDKSKKRAVHGLYDDINEWRNYDKLMWGSMKSER